MRHKIQAALASRDGWHRLRDYVFARVWFALPAAVRKPLVRGESCRCPICETHLRRFMVLHRPNQLFCPICRSMQRQRLVMLFLQQYTNLFDGVAKRLLHIAPEPSLAPRLRRAPGVDYLSGDLMDRAAMVRMDITDIQYPDASFDCLYCSHVLEHVPDDARAMRELFRVLRPGGWALILVPIRGERTFEDRTITKPRDRERAFGQCDHVRFYGMDFRDRLAKAGFRVTVLQPDAIAPTPGNREAMGLACGQVFFYCEKPLAPAVTSDPAPWDGQHGRHDRPERDALRTRAPGTSPSGIPTPALPRFVPAP